MTTLFLAGVVIALFSIVLLLGSLRTEREERVSRRWLEDQIRHRR